MHPGKLCDNEHMVRNTVFTEHLGWKPIMKSPDGGVFKLAIGISYNRPAASSNTIGSWLLLMCPPDYLHNAGRRLAGIMMNCAVSSYVVISI